MAKIPEKMRWIYDLLLTAAILAMATVLCTLLRRIDDGSGYVNLIFVLAVATISRWTEGYFWGIFSAVSGVLFVNYVFTYPYWEFNFTITGYPFTFLAMLTVSMMISAMNTQIKKQERLRIETEKEARARQSPARDVARYPHAADEHRRQHRRDPRKRGFGFLPSRSAAFWRM